jgi:hypothetical protein
MIELRRNRRSRERTGTHRELNSLCDRGEPNDISLQHSYIGLQIVFQVYRLCMLHMRKPGQHHILILTRKRLERADKLGELRLESCKLGLAIDFSREDDLIVSRTRRL